MGATRYFSRSAIQEKLRSQGELQTQCGRTGYTVHPYTATRDDEMNRGSMSDESDFDLRPDQWEALKVLRTPFAAVPSSPRLVLDDLLALGLVCMSDCVPVITAKGRKTLIRGSFRLLDAAA